MIELKSITKTYKSKKGQPTEALKGIDLKLSDKGLTFILGKSGSGKTTLLNILGGFDTYTTGEIIVDGKSTSDFKEKDWDLYRNTYMGFVFQEYNLLDNYNIEENIKLPLELQHKKATKEELLKVLEKVDLEDILKRKINELSGGQKQRVAIARALIKDPDILLCDEPTGNLDSETSEQIFELLKKLSKDKLVVVVSHDEEAAHKYADRIVKIVDGKISDDTNSKDKFKSKKEFHLVPARLPFSYGIKIAFSNLFKKKLRLLFTILTLTLCFICVGTTIGILNANITDEFINTFKEKGPTEMFVQKYNRVVDYKAITIKILSTFNNEDIEYDEIFPSPISFDESFIQEIEEKTKLEWNGIYNINIDEFVTYGQDNADLPMYYHPGAISFTKTDAIKNSNKLKGTITDDSIVITNYIADYIINYGIKTKNSITEYSEEYIYKPSSYDQIINDQVYIKLNGLDYFKVSGILEVDTSKYQVFKDITYNKYLDLEFEDKDKYLEYEELQEEMDNEYFLTRIYIPDNILNKYKEYKKNYTLPTIYEMYKYNGVYKMFYEDILHYGYLLENSSVYNGDTIVTLSDLSDNEMVINTLALDVLTNGDYKTKLVDYLEMNEGKTETDYLNIYIKNNNIIGQKFVTNIVDNHVYMDMNSNNREYKIVGVTLENPKANNVYFPKKEIKDLISPVVTLKQAYRYVDSLEELENILKYYPLDKSDALLYCSFSGEIQSLVMGTYILQRAGLIAGIVLSILSFIFLSNFIITSIKLRKKEIGIFRALGCRSLDMLRMFTIECMLLLLICLGIATSIVPHICNAINDMSKEGTYIKLDAVLFNFKSILLMFGIASILTILVSGVAMLKVSKQKPVDTILDK